MKYKSFGFDFKFELWPAGGRVLGVSVSQPSVLEVARTIDLAKFIAHTRRIRNVCQSVRPAACNTCLNALCGAFIIRLSVMCVYIYYTLCTPQLTVAIYLKCINIKEPCEWKQFKLNIKILLQKSINISLMISRLLYCR